MPRTARVAVGGVIYHVINRANAKRQIFHSNKEFQHFESLLLEAVELIDMRILAYCIMPNHWHLILYPKNNGDLSEFMRWLTTTHARQTRVATKSVGFGHLYQGSYKSFIIEKDKHLIDVIRYVEQNPLRANLVKRAEEWPWSSLFRRRRGSKEDKKILATLPTTLPSNYLESVNTLLTNLKELRHSVVKGKPYGSEDWVSCVVDKYDLGSTLRGVGRPKSY